ncbi:MAG: PLD nuclease N-terminal domain-containing protein [bacterium]
MESVLANWKLLLPILIIQVGLQVFALVDLVRRPKEEIKGPKVLWGIVILAFQMLGPMVYLVFGRR